MSAPVIPINGKGTKKGRQPTTKGKTDWEAVERDYRCTNMTLRELGTKHNCLHTSIANKAKREGWSRDLTGAIHQATQTALIEASIAGSVNKHEQGVTSTVLATAEMNKGVILGHRKDITQVRDLTMGLASELSTVSLKQDDMEALFGLLTSEMSEQQMQSARKAFNDLMRLPNRIQGAKALAEAITKLQALERTAFSLDITPEEDAKGNPVSTMTDAERAVRLVNMIQKGQMPQLPQQRAA